MRKFKRSDDHRIIGGVCSGFAYYLGIPTWIVRVVWFVAICGYGTGLIFYLLLWLLLPEWEKDPKDFKKITGE